MTKKETLTFFYESCGECSNADTKNGKHYCILKERRIPFLWGEIPEWCPLSDKMEVADGHK